MTPNIINISENEKGYLNFRLNNINVSLANGLRRIILSEIPIYVFKTSPYEKNKAEIEINTTRMNNELIKQRLSCIPIHITTESDFPLQDYQLVIDEENTSNSIRYITTEQFKIKHKENNKFISQAEVKKIFPPDKITNDYIVFARLRPKLSDDLDGEKLKLTCDFDMGTAKEDGMFNIVSTCAYSYTIDELKQQKEWAKIEKELNKKHDEASVEQKKRDWMLLEGQTYTIKNSFDYTIESVGVYTNQKIVQLGCSIMIQKIMNFIDMVQKDTSIIPADSTIPNSYDIILKKEGYTLGKVIEFLLYKNFYENEEILSYCGFKKPHPHIDESILRLAFKEPLQNQSFILPYLLKVSEEAIGIFKHIEKEFS
jgi:DNA-directed RNA polymerase subunit L